MKMKRLFGMFLLAAGVVSASELELKNQDFSEGFAGWLIKVDEATPKTCDTGGNYI